MKQRKKVVHISTVHHPYDTRIYHKECLSLQKAGFDVSFITVIDEAAIPDDAGIHMIPLKRRRGRLRRMFLSTWEAYRKAKRLEADCYHIHDPELLPAGWGLKTKHNTVIYDVHEDYTTSIAQKTYIPKGFRKIVASFYKFAEKLFSRKMALCLAEKYYVDQYPEGACILNYPVIHENAMNLDNDSHPVTDRLLYTGNISVDRGAFIHAQLPKMDASITVHFTGKCPGHLAKAMHGIAGDAADRLFFNGIDTFIEREEMDAKYHEHNWLAGLALFPPTPHYRHKELTKFFEYMAYGIPIIASDFPLWTEFMAQHGCGITVDPHNPREMAEAIRYLQQNPHETRKMGHNGKKAIMEKLNWQQEALKLIHLYQKLLDQETPPTGYKPADQSEMGVHR